MDSPTIDLATLIEGFRLSCQTEGKSPKTVEWYSAFLARFLSYLDSHGRPTAMDQLDKNHVRQFIRHLQTEARTPRTNLLLSPSTVQGYVRTLKAFFSWTEREGYTAFNLMAKIPVPKAPVKVIDTFSSDQIAKLIAASERSNKSGCRNLSIILLMLDCGLRVSEVANIELENTNLAEGYIKVSGAKGGRERMVPIGSLVQKCLWRYIHCFRPKPLTETVSKLFLNDGGLPLTKNGIQQMLRRCGQRAGLSGVRCSPHTLRHTFAKAYLLNGGDIFSLQRILGHSSLASVRIYLNLFLADVKRQHQRFSPVDNLVASAGLPHHMLWPGSGRPRNSS